MSEVWLTAVAPVSRPTFAVSGWNRCRGSGCSRRHRGMDFRAPIGSPVFSILPGTVVSAGSTSGEAGKLITVAHVDGLVSRYMHLSKILVSEGDTVTAGELIAESGDTGAKGRPHLHFDLILDGIQLPTWAARFGFPKGGVSKFQGSDVLFKVPVEPIIPIDAGNSHVFREAKKLGIRVRQDDSVKALLPITAAIPILNEFSTPELIALGGLTFAGVTIGSLIGRRRGRPGLGAVAGLMLGGLGGYLVARQVGNASDSGCV